MNRDHLHTLGVVLLLVLLVPFVVFAVPQAVGGSSSYVVTSSSMSPTIAAGDVVIVDGVDTDSIEKGDIIVFERSGNDEAKETTTRLTHRVVEVMTREGGRRFETKGDANEKPDSKLVAADQVEGAVMFWIPYIGWLITWSGTDTGILTLLVVPMGLLALGEVWDLYRDSRSAAETETNDNNSEGDNDG